MQILKREGEKDKLKYKNYHLINENCNFKYIDDNLN